MKKELAPLPSDWIAQPVIDWCERVGISLSHAYALKEAKKLRFAKAGNKTLITRDESDRFLALVSNEEIAAHPLAKKRRAQGGNNRKKAAA